MAHAQTYYDSLDSIPPKLTNTVEVFYGGIATYTQVNGPRIRLRTTPADLVGTSTYGLRFKKRLNNRLWATVGYYGFSYELDYIDDFQSGAFAFSVGGNSSSQVPILISYELATVPFGKKGAGLYFISEAGVNLQFVHGNNVESSTNSFVRKAVFFTNGLHFLPEAGLAFQIRPVRKIGIQFRYSWLYGFSTIKRENILENGQLVGTASTNGTGATLSIGLQFYFQ
jgi:hypothetical protein